MQEVVLYYGDNGHQEFWQSRRGDVDVLFLRVKGWDIWSAFKDDAVLMDKEAQAAETRHTVSHILSANDPIVLADTLLEQYNIQVIFSTAKQWQFGKPKKFPMVLRRVP